MVKLDVEVSMKRKHEDDKKKGEDGCRIDDEKEV